MHLLRSRRLQRHYAVGGKARSVTIVNRLFARTGERSVEPLDTAILFLKFAGALADHDQAETVKLAVDYFKDNADARAEPVATLTHDIQVVPYLGSALIAAMNGDALSFTLAVQKFLAQETLLQKAFGISRVMEQYQTSNRCPVGHHFTAFPAWVKPDGSQASRLTTWSMLYNISPLMRCRCRRGHEWLVFPMQS